jgi:hypothetical protein
MIGEPVTLPLSRSGRRRDCMDCKRRARAGRQTCKGCGDRREAFAREPRITLLHRCTVCGSGEHSAVWCPLRERS